VRVKKRKHEEAATLVAREAWKAKVKQITPILIAPKKTREGKASSFPQIRDFVVRKHGINNPKLLLGTLTILSKNGMG